MTRRKTEPQPVTESDAPEFPSTREVAPIGAKVVGTEATAATAVAEPPAILATPAQSLTPQAPPTETAPQDPFDRVEEAERKEREEDQRELIRLLQIIEQEPGAAHDALAIGRRLEMDADAMRRWKNLISEIRSLYADTQLQNTLAADFEKAQRDFEAERDKCIRTCFDALKAMGISAQAMRQAEGQLNQCRSASSTLETRSEPPRAPSKAMTAEGDARNNREYRQALFRKAMIDAVLSNASNFDGYKAHATSGLQRSAEASNAMMEPRWSAVATESASNALRELGQISLFRGIGFESIRRVIYLSGVAKPAGADVQIVKLTDEQWAATQQFRRFWQTEAWPAAHPGKTLPPYDSEDSGGLRDVLTHPSIGWDVEKAKAIALAFFATPTVNEDQPHRPREIAPLLEQLTKRTSAEETASSSTPG